MEKLEAMPGHLIRRLQQIAVSIFAQRMAEAELDLTAVQFAALATMTSHPGLDQQGLAGMIACDRVTIGQVIGRLIIKGYVIRRANSSDRRAHTLSLTEAGHEAFALASPWVELAQKDILADLSSQEQEMFLKLITKMTFAGNHLSRAPLRRTKT